MAVNQYVRTFRDLSEAVHDAGLLQRQRSFYLKRLIGWVVALAVLVSTVAVVGPTWFHLIVAALIGLVLAQLGFLSHEAAHRGIFSSRAANEWTSRFIAGLLLGLSYSWWMAKHNSHHAHPNQEGEDPDIDSKLLAFTPDASDRRQGLGAVLARKQGYFFALLLFLEGLNLHFAALRTLVTSPQVPHRYTELALVIARHAAYLTLLFLVLPVGMGFAFLGVQIGVFGFLLGGAFALNHIGMPSVPAGMNVDFFRRQVVMSRNIKDGPWVRFFMGGLQFQIEHHLFPVAPRPNLVSIQSFVQEECSRFDVAYTQRTVKEAAITVVTYLNQVGLKHRDPYVCPLVKRYGG